MFESQVDRILTQVFQEYWLNQISGIKEDRFKAVDFYENNHKDYIEQYIQIDADDIPITYTGITKKIIKKVAQVYNNPASRTLEQGEDKYLDVTELKDYWNKEAERRTKLLGVIAYGAFWKDNKLDYRIIQNYIPIFDGDSLNPIGITYPIIGGEKAEQVWVVWTDQEHYVTDSEGQRLKASEQELYGVNEEQINPYGICPFTSQHARPLVSDYWTQGAEDLINANEMIDLNLTDLNYLARYQAFSIIYTTGLNDGDAQKIKISAKDVIGLPDGTTINSLDLQSKINDLIESIKFQVQLIERNYGLNINWGIEGAPSGFSLVVQNVDLLEAWKDDIGIANIWEKEIFEIEKRIIEVETGVKVDGLKVNFAEPRLPINKTEEMAYWDWLVERKLKTWADYYVEVLDTDISPEDAQKEIEENAETVVNVENIGKPVSALDKLLGVDNEN